MKILIHSNSPHTKTGYGVQCGQLCDQLAEMGHEVAVSSTWGTQGESRMWESPHGHKILCLPNGWQVNSVDVIHEHALYWFDNDPQGGIIISNMDQWGLARNPMLKEFKLVAWTPVDHAPCPPGVLEMFANTGAVPIAMSKFGATMLEAGGLDPLYAPLTVDTDVYRRVETVDTADGPVPIRSLFEIPEDKYVVLSVAMNKDLSDRKGFGGMIFAMAQFLESHPDAVWVLHTEPTPAMEGLDLNEIAQHAGIDTDRMIYTNSYAIRLGFSPEMMAALFSTADVLLCASRGEGFGVPLIEAQSCGTPVIVTDFSSMPELVGAGWKVPAQPEWDPMQRALYARPLIDGIVTALEEAHIVMSNPETARVEREDARSFAEQYDTTVVFEKYWKPILEKLDPPPPEPRPKLDTVDVIVPLMRKHNAARLLDSLNATNTHGVNVLTGTDDSKTYAQNVNEQYARSTADWVLVVGDDVEFTDGWLAAAIEASQWGDVIGTNDSEEGRVRNPDVAAGRHADHFLIRRSYIEELGASLDGPGTLMHEGYGHWYTDKELIELAKARGVYYHAHECRIVHHHPGYDGDESAREADPVYMQAVERSDADQKLFMQRAPLIEMHRS